MKRDCKTLICMTEEELQFFNDLVVTYNTRGVKVTKSDVIRFAIRHLPKSINFDFGSGLSKVRASNTAL